MSARRLTAVEIFAGGGGLAVGLQQAGFETVAAVEIERHAAATFRANHPCVRVFEQDVRSVSGRELIKLAKGKLDLLAACPPCQGFSSLTSKWHRADPRNELVAEVARLAEEMRPRAVMVENVPGLADKGRALLDTLIARLQAAGYVCEWRVLQVADYGIPQRRRRLVLLAGLGFGIAIPRPTHSRTGADGRSRWKTLADAIGGLDEPVTFAEAKARGGPAIVNWHVTRTLSEATRLRLHHAKPGEPWKALPEELRPRCHRGTYSGFTNAYGRLRWNEPSVTITSGCTTLAKGRFGHPEQDRTISLREAALLQTFPLDYRFETPFIDKACEIVGNALPCEFARIVAGSAADALRARSARSPARTLGARAG